MKLNQVLYKFLVLERVHLVEAIKSYDDKLWDKFMMNFHGHSRNGEMGIRSGNPITNDMIYNFIDCIDAFASSYLIEIVFVLFIMVLNQ